MEKLSRTETEYYFEVDGKRWWVLSSSSDDWKVLSNDDAYKLGLFAAVRSQECEFIDTNIEAYKEAVSEIVESLDKQLQIKNAVDAVESIHEVGTPDIVNLNGSDRCILKPKESIHENEVISTQLPNQDLPQNSPVKGPKDILSEDNLKMISGSVEDERVIPKKAPLPVKTAPLPAGKIPLPAKKVPLPTKKVPLPVNKTPLLVNKAPLPLKTPIPKTIDQKPIKQGEEESANDATPEPIANEPELSRRDTLKNQISDLIASTSNMKECYRAQRRQTEPMKEKTTTLRSTARRLTYANNGGLAGCLKTVAEEREKMGAEPEFIKTRDNKLDKMMQRARNMAAKTLSSEKMKDAAEALRKGLENKKSPTNKIFVRPRGSINVNDLKPAKTMYEVTFEASSDSSEDCESKNMAIQPPIPPQQRQGMDQILAERPSIRRKTVVLNED